MKSWNIFERLASFEFVKPDTFFGAVFYAIVFAVVAWAMRCAINVAVRRVLARPRHVLIDPTLISFLQQLAKWAIYIMAFVTYAHLVPALNPIGKAWLTGVSVVSVIVGLAAQSTLSNLIAGFSLLLYRPFGIGDRMQASAPSGLETGTVESLNLGYVILKTDDNRRVVIPNSVIASQTTINLTGVENVACTVPINVSYGSDIDKARTLLTDLARRHPKVKEVSGCPVTQIGTTGAVLNLSCLCADSGAVGQVKNDLLEQAIKHLPSAGVEIPYTYTNVIVAPPSASLSASLESDHKPSLTSPRG